MDSSRKSPNFYRLKQRKSSSRPPSWHYDLFLSFRGEDTRKTFSDDLYKALMEAGIHTFRDDDELRRGNDISSELITAIQESRASIVVFSKDYASSRWCLAELVTILGCKRTADQLVFPVFYYVDRDDVRWQTGSFGSAFTRHEERFDRNKVDEWRNALTEAASLEGWELNHHTSRSEEMEFVEKIVREIRHKVKQKLFMAKYPVGLDSRIEELRSLIKDGVNDGCVIGVHGISGIGKTTIVKEFFNTNIQRYECGGFLTNVQERLKQSNGLVHLQNELLLSLEGKNHMIENINEGIITIKSKLRSKRVLVVLDDLNELSQLEYLIGNPLWFGKGSVIVITSKSRCILDQAKVDLSYEVNELSHEESLMLLCWNAFGGPVPLQCHKDILREMLNYIHRTPLNLELIGSSLVGKTSFEWKSMLEKLKRKHISQLQ